MVLSHLVLFDSCKYHDKFPLTIDDIDTLSIFHNYHDSLASLSKIKSNNPEVNEQPTLNNDNLRIPTVRWTICTGVFEVKQNASRKFFELNKESIAYLIIRENKHYIT